MNQREFLKRWMRHRPSRIRRSRWFLLGMRIHDHARAIGFPFRSPRWWWFCKRVRLHYRYGLPMPAKPAYNREV